MTHVMGRTLEEEYSDLQEEYAFADTKTERVYLAGRMQDCLNRLAVPPRPSTPGK